MRDSLFKPASNKRRNAKLQNQISNILFINFKVSFDLTRAPKIDVPKIDLNELLFIHLVAHPCFVQKLAIPNYSMIQK